MPIGTIFKTPLRGDQDHLCWKILLAKIKLPVQLYSILVFQKILQRMPNLVISTQILKIETLLVFPNSGY